MAKTIPFFSIYGTGNDNGCATGRNPLHCPRATRTHPMCRARITTKFNIHKDNGGHFTRYLAIHRSISAALVRRRSQIVSHVTISFDSVFIAVFIPIAIQTLSIGAIAKSISRSRGLSPHSIRSIHPPLWRRPMFCDRRLTPPSLSTPPRRHPAFGATCDKSSHRCCALISFFFLLLSLDSFAR